MISRFKKKTIHKENHFRKEKKNVIYLTLFSKKENLGSLRRDRKNKETRESKIRIWNNKKKALEKIIKRSIGKNLR